MPNPQRHPWAGLAAWGLLVFGAAALGAIASADAPSFYRALSLPDWAPAPGIFGPVWSVLYVLMAIAVWLVWKSPASRSRTMALAWFVVQLVLNALWSWWFFAWKSGQGAFIDIVLLLAAIAGTLVLFSRVRPLAAALMLPYLAWVLFATALTWTVWQLNPALL